MLPHGNVCTAVFQGTKEKNKIYHLFVVCKSKEKTDEKKGDEKKIKVKQEREREREMKKVIREIVDNYANPSMISAFYFCIECMKRVIFKNVRRGN